MLHRLFGEPAQKHAGKMEQSLCQLLCMGLYERLYRDQHTSRFRWPKRCKACTTDYWKACTKGLCLVYMHKRAVRGLLGQTAAKPAHKVVGRLMQRSCVYHTRTRENGARGLLPGLPKNCTSNCRKAYAEDLYAPYTRTRDRRKRLAARPAQEMQPSM